MSAESELELAKELKSVCCRVALQYKERTESLPESARILGQLSSNYMQKSPDKVSLIRSATLINAAIVRQPSNKEYIDQRNKLCCHVLETAGAAKLDADLVAFSKQVASKIEEMRKQVYTETILEINEAERQNIMCELKSDVTIEEIIKAEKTEIEKTRLQQDLISRNYAEVMKFVSTYCEHTVGDSPCQYSVVGLGSLARKEITPYSDFEHVILLEEGSQNRDDYEKILEHFRWFSVIFQLVVINLGETIIPAVAIPSLNDFSTPGGDWFFDAYTKRGVSFDGMMWHACKMPLGRMQKTSTKKWTTELIKPVSEMLNYLDPETDIKNGYNLGDILTRTCFIAGSRPMFDQFAAGVRDSLSNNQVARREILNRQIDFDLKRFSVVHNLLDLYGAYCANIKRTLYRTLTLFISALGRLAKCDSYSCFEIVDDFKNRNLINDNTAHRLHYVIALACQIRLKVYRQHGSQTDFVLSDIQQYQHILDSDMPLQLAKMVGEKRMLDYFTVACDLQTAIKCPDILERLDHYLKPRLSTRFRVLRFVNIYDQLLCEWDEFLRHPRDVALEEHMWMRFYVAGAHRRNEKYDTGLTVLEWFDDREISDPSLRANVLVTKQKCLYFVGKHDEALDVGARAQALLEDVDLVPAEKYDLLCHSLSFHASCLSEEKQQHMKAIEVFKKERLYLRDHEVVAKAPREAVCLVNISECYMKADLYEKATNRAEKALGFLFRINGPADVINQCRQVVEICRAKMQ
ncbi:unnamed protein product [Clavelina lepadiformis]|uniref:Protein-PII uridylyltransferase N-terminal domain-containing protein n=1 Tax=Clavelina lepadiformis TaxID=159417 RepID=A0ABP0GDE2_CLALP